MNELKNDNVVYRTAPATPGLVITTVFVEQPVCLVNIVIYHQIGENLVYVVPRKCFVEPETFQSHTSIEIFLEIFHEGGNVKYIIFSFVA